VAGVLLNKSKSQGGGWIVITAGWAFGVIFGVLTAKAFGSSDAHLNPAVSLAFAILNRNFSNLPIFILAQVLGAFLGGVLVYLHYLPHWREANSPETILAVFSTDPAIEHPFSNFFSESLGTFVLILGIHVIFHKNLPNLNPHFGIFLVGILVWSIGLSMGGTTGYAINPARDFGPRLVHYLFPIPNKGSSNWKYAWIPVLAPLFGSTIASFFIKGF
jgi:glycerol uptake facilitator protein